MSSNMCSEVISKIKAVSTRFGISEMAVSKNGPKFAAEKMSRFANEWKFLHVTKNLDYPQVNGLLERSVQTAKSLFMKATTGREGSYRSLLERRNRQEDGLASPAQSLMSRSLRSTLPTIIEQLEPNIVNLRIKASHPKTPLQQGSQKATTLGDWKTCIPHTSRKGVLKKGRYQLLHSWYQ